MMHNVGVSGGVTAREAPVTSLIWNDVRAALGLDSGIINGGGVGVCVQRACVSQQYIDSRCVHDDRVHHMLATTHRGK